MSAQQQGSSKRSGIVLPLPPKQSDEVYLAALAECGGYYNTPVDQDGKPLGPLVGYSGRYKDEAAGEMRQYVGFRYFNLATLEQHPRVADFFALGLASVVQGAFPEVDCIVGVPEGGLMIGHNTARHLGVMYAGLQKKVVALATKTSKEQTALMLGRHDIEIGMNVLLAEDLVNNFSTTDKAIGEVMEAGACVVGIVCGLNRSDNTTYGALPVVSLVHLPTPQYRQDDPAVAEFIANPSIGVVWDVKPNWPILKKVMDDAAARGVPLASILAARGR